MLQQCLKITTTVSLQLIVAHVILPNHPKFVFVSYFLTYQWKLVQTFVFRNFLVCLLKSRAMKSKIQITFGKFNVQKLISQWGFKIDLPLSSYVLGGTHMTNPALLVSRILKELTATEDTFYGWVAKDIFFFLAQPRDSNWWLKSCQRLREHWLLIVAEWGRCGEGTENALQVYLWFSSLCFEQKS